MGNVADEATQIRELLEEYLPQLAGGGAVEVTAEQIATAMAGALAALGIRASAGGQAAGLYVPALAGDELPAVRVGAADSFTAGIEARSGFGSAVVADTVNGFGLNVNVSGNGLPVLINSAATSPEQAGVDVRRAPSEPPAGVYELGRWRLVDVHNATPPAGLAGRQYTAVGLADAAWEDTEIEQTAPYRTRRTLYLNRAGTMVAALRVDGADSETQTNLAVLHNGTLRRLMAGGDGALYLEGGSPGGGGGPVSWDDITEIPGALVQLAGVSPSAFGLALLELSSAARLRAVAGIGSAQPADHGLLAWTVDPALATNTIVLTGGQITIARAMPLASGSVNNILTDIQTAGSGLTSGQNYAAIYDAAGNRLGITGDMTTTWGTTGVKTMALTSPATVTAGTPVYIAFLSNGTTPPTLRRTATNTGLVNFNLTTSAPRFATSGTGNTALPSSITISSFSLSANSILAALN